MFGPWQQIAPGYGKMVLGYFGKTPVPADSQIVELASKKLKLEPTTENPLDIADRDEKKSLLFWKGRLAEEGIETTDENIFIAAACDEKGIAFLKGNSPLNVRKISNETKNEGEVKTMANSVGNYTVIVNGIKYSVQVADGDGANIEVTKIESCDSKASACMNNDSVVNAVVQVSEGDQVVAGQTLVILEAMKMEIEVKASKDGVVSKIAVAQGDAVQEGSALIYID